MLKTIYNEQSWAARALLFPVKIGSSLVFDFVSSSLVFDFVSNLM